MLRRSSRVRARALTAQAARLLDTDVDGAEALYRRAVTLHPDLHAAWFDLGLICKWSRRWEEALECNSRATAIIGEKVDEPAWWNLGIAATALRRWDIARSAWRTYGIEVPAGSGEIEADYGNGPVRLNPGGDAEVVWGHRIDPARMRIMSIPLPQSGHRWGDVVLHDGAPNGYRELRGQQVPVFDELERWQPSAVPTVTASVSAPSAADIDDLLEFFDAAGLAAEDWTGNVRTLCKRCSESIVHAEHSEDRLAAGQEQFIGVAGPLREVEGVVQRWTRTTGRICHELDETS